MRLRHWGVCKIIFLACYCQRADKLEVGGQAIFDPRGLVEWIGGLDWARIGNEATRMEGVLETILKIAFYWVAEKPEGLETKQ
ncbi:hypothetical protein B0T18DRAFT_230897 [Schizothecium vesticola]|uniref:Uncharacterized protein n=1 Tax=Schizothecium vesticola TaxID=314040 RepID=A0AA40K0G7_9PEZI|nr:hypothetical protein B0T18DRAFT_230897 [Schizothecium vesticola]